MSSDQQGAVPPPYHESISSTSPSDRKTTSTKIPPRMHLYYDKGVLSENQKMYIQSCPEPSNPKSKAKLYHSSFVSESLETLSMHVYKCETEEEKRGEGVYKGRELATVQFPGAKEKEKQNDIRITFAARPEMETMLMRDMGMEGLEGYEDIGVETTTTTASSKSKSRDPAVAKVPITIHQRVYHWSGTESDKYPSSNKGKGKVGDVELIDDEGNIVAVFLNEWKGKKVEEYRVGVLEWREGWKEDEDGVDRVVVTLMGLVERYQFLNRAIWRKLGESSVKTGLVCIVS